MGVSEQDAAVQDSQGPIADRTREHLGPTDLGIMHFRKLIMEAARALQQGEAPPQLNAPGPLRRAFRCLRHQQDQRPDRGYDRAIWRSCGLCWSAADRRGGVTLGANHARPGSFRLRPRRCAVAALALLASLASICSSLAAPAEDAACGRSQPAGGKCDRAKFRIILDVGHTKESYGALSSRHVPEFEFNLNLGKTHRGAIEGGWICRDFPDGDGRQGAAEPDDAGCRANKRGADLFLSIHHDSVPGIYNESWEFEGKRRHFNDLFGGYSVFVSQRSPRYGESLRFAKLLGNQMASQDLIFARQYDQWFMGKYQRQLLDSDAGVYRYDELIVLKMTTMPAVLLESGSIINREEELVMASEAHKNKVATAVSLSAAEYCETRTAAPPQTSQPQPKPAPAKPQTSQSSAKPQPAKPQPATRAATRKR